MASKKIPSYYMVPAADPHVTTNKHVNEDAYFSSDYNTQAGDPEKPFITTYQTAPDLNSIWIFVPVSGEDNYYYIVHALTGKYVKYQTYLTGNNERRKFVHLETITAPGETEKFEITTLNEGVKIKPKNNTMYFNVAGDNQARYNGGTSSPYYSGIIGGMSGTDDNSQFNLSDASSAITLTPEISDVDGTTNTFTITSPAAAFSTIRYTTDGSTTPTAIEGTTTTSGSSIVITDNWTVQAVGVFGSFVTPVASKALAQVITSPVITFDNTTGNVTLTTLTVGAAIYYTLDGTTEPTSSSTLYEGPFSISETTTIKAITIKGGENSSVTTQTIYKVATPTIQDNGSNAISITTTTPNATIYYTTDGSTPTTSSTEYTVPLTENVSNVTIKAIAVKADMITSAVGSGTVKLQCATPIITRTGLTFTLSCSKPTDADLYYTLGGGSETLYNGPVAFTPDQLPITVTAVARHSDYTQSETASVEFLNGTGTPSDPYMIYSAADYTNFVTDVNNGTTASACYKMGADISASGMDAITTEFTGTFDGDGYIISNLRHALFNTVNGGTVKNVILDNVTISGGTNTGAICNEATGGSRIYNCGVLATNSTVGKDGNGYDYISSCSSTISGSGFVGSIVGLLNNSSRVINCFSYANITDGDLVGGIVGKNNSSTTSTNLQTMVMNCMFYGDITGGTSKAPIYNGEIITNRSDASGVSNFNYFWAGASYVQEKQIDVYNCALAAETRFLQRFEFFRHLLNSNRELAAWWATDNASNKDNIMKWVMEPSQIGTSIPYPILKAAYDREHHIIKYPSMVNIDAANAESFSSDATIAKTQYNQGRKFGTLTITIQNAQSGGPSEASITTSSVTPNITDKDPAHFNFNYYKVQLPYYNDVGTKNYTDNKVVTGWKIVSMSTSTGSFTTGSDATATVDENGDITLTTPYNFADRNCTAKDIYSNDNKRVFNQGAYFDVPEGVTSITIEPYWGNCVYVSDQYPDVVYNQTMSASSNVTSVGGGERYVNNTAYNINGSSQKVYTSMGNAVTALNPSSTSTVYDNAIVLVGNVHSLSLSSEVNNKPFTITSIDLDKDNEPDYSYILSFTGRVRVHPVRIDFLNVIGLGMAQKSNGGTGTYNFGILQPYGWFEVTNTGLFRVTQFEYDNAGTNSSAPRLASPMILQGGVIEQWVTVGGSEQKIKAANSVTYYHVGGNVWFKEFHIGVHQDKTQEEFVSPHPPISVTGGDFDEFYLTGLYNTPNNNYDDNAECYINGGHFGKVAGTGMQGIGGFTMDGSTKTSYSNGNIIWQIDNADIDEFYGGGINAAHIAEGNITTVISNSRVDLFCGGPKFGDMNSDKKVATNATNCTFRTFFGAGYGGNSYNREYPTNKYNDYNYNWNAWLTTVYKKEYKSAYKGVSTRFNYQFIPKSDNDMNVARLFIDYVSFSLATTYDVVSKLTDCTITTSTLGNLDLFSQCIGNFYGGGSLGKVDGPVKSTLTNCTVEGNVYGAGYSATIPSVGVMNNSFQTEPHYDGNLGAYLDAELPASVPFTWEHRSNPISSTSDAINTTNHILYTTLDLNSLGTVDGTISLTISGTSIIGTSGNALTGSVYGGGEESSVTGNISVTLEGDTQVMGDVFGGGNKGPVTGNTEVILKD